MYNYYSDLFNYKIPSFSLAILRKDPTDNIYLIGGSSAQTLGTTFDPNNKRDWELMGHRLFHAFFESKVSHTAFHTPPTLWFYEGLATYYENVSMGSLPQEITNKLGIDTRGNFSTLFNTYAYMRYKDSNLLSIIPMNEEQIQKSGGETEFLHYTQAPLIVKAIEERSYAINKKKNNMLNYVLDKCVGKINKKIDVKSIIMSALGEETDSFSKAYLYGNNVLPLWGLSENKKEDPELVVKSLKDMEYTLWSWFSKDNTSYLKDDITLNNILQYYDLAEKANVHFTSVEVEEKIKTESPTIYFLLKQYAFRAYICGVNLNDRDARIKLLGDKINIDKWNAVLKMR
ncbi:MAG: hypothetical protein ACD_26C00077G0001 [uncultured bacterium]|nr:MAG: hypothetical protein ACD_26C00077G0001 [uncultured bacterium]